MVIKHLQSQTLTGCPIHPPNCAHLQMSYKDGFQRRYFVLPSFTEGAALLNQYACDVHAGKASAPLPRAEKAR